MKKLCALIIMLTMAGCVSISVPQYIPEESEYKQKFYADFSDVFNASNKALGDAGWKISGTANPVLYEEIRNYNPKDGKQILIFTETKQSMMLLFSRYNRVNLLLRSMEEGTEVEVRFAAVTAYPFRSTYRYRNDKLVEKILNSISVYLKQ